MVETARVAAEVVSPCIGICRLDAADVCEGCGRTLDEICGWLKADPASRQQIVERAALRRAARPETPA